MTSVKLYLSLVGVLYHTTKSHALTIPAIENALQTFRNNSNARG